MALRKTLQSPLDSKETQPVHPKGNQSWIFIGRTEAEAEAILLWPTDRKNWLIGKDPDAGKTEVWGDGDNRGWDVWLASLIDGHELKQSVGVGDGQEKDWRAAVHGDAKSPTQLSDWTELIVIDQLDLIDIYRTFHPKTMNFTFFSSAHETFPRIDHILGYKSSLGKLKKKNEIIPSIFSDYNAVRLDLNYRRKT